MPGLNSAIDESTRHISSLNVLGLRVAVTTLQKATTDVIGLAYKKEGAYICAANVHMCMEAYRDKGFQHIVNNASLTVPDGRPLTWWMRSLGIDNIEQVRGPDLFLSVCNKACQTGIPIAFYGGETETLNKLKMYLLNNYNDIKIACAISPPFRELTENEEASHIDQLRESGAQILFVGLGCPKQEKWMAKVKKDLAMVMLGVGAAFDFYAGNKSIAPRWMSRSGLEWLYRLLCEPRRLWKRYLYTNPHFMYLYARAIIKKRLNRIFLRRI